MRMTHKIASALTLIAMAAVSGGTAMADQNRGWTVGKPIVTYWAGPAMTDAAAQQMADGKFNLVWCGEKELDVVQRHGLRAQLTDALLTPETLDDPAKTAQLDALIERVRRHPALYDYFITDEPDTSRFAGLGKLVAHLREKDPAHLAYINLLPTYATNEQLGTKGDVVPAYVDYLKQFINVVKPALISWDHYQFAIDHDMPDYFLNLALIRRACLEAKLPFLNIIQAATWSKSMREPSEDEMRYLVWTSAAYGAQGISYYVYSVAGHTPLIATLDGTPTKVYYWVQKFNPDFEAVAEQLQKLKSTGVYHAGMLPPGADALPETSDFRVDPELPTGEFVKRKPVTGVLLGCFGKTEHSQPTHCVVVNLNYVAPATVTIVSQHHHYNLEVFDTATRKWAAATEAKGKVTLSLPPGGGKLIRTKR